MLSDVQTTSFYSAQLPKDPKTVAGKFEAMFYRILFKQMEESELEDPLLASAESKQIRSMQFDELSDHLGRQGELGIQEMILEQIEPEKPRGLLKGGFHG